MMFVINPKERCPYSDKCSGYVGGYLCTNEHYINCDRFKLLQEADNCYEEMERLLRGLNENGTTNK